MTAHMENPAVQGGALSNVTLGIDGRENNKKPRKSKGLTVRFEAADGTHMAFLKGREAWALRELMAAGLSGVTPITQPGPRWSHYVMKLRRRGIDIETIPEDHGGPYPGRHGRYVLRTPVQIGGAE